MTFQIAYARRPLARRNTRAGFAALGPDQFEGYASLFGVPDAGGDTVAAGAFAASLRRRPQVRMLYQHFSHAPIGVWEEIAEDARGLYVRGRLVPDVEQARDVRAAGRWRDQWIVDRLSHRARQTNGREAADAAGGRSWALCACSTPPPAAPIPATLPPASLPASLTMPPRMLNCLRLSPCLPPISASRGKMPTS